MALGRVPLVLITIIATMSITHLITLSLHGTGAGPPPIRDVYIERPAVPCIATTSPTPTPPAAPPPSPAPALVQTPTTQCWNDDPERLKIPRTVDQHTLTPFDFIRVYGEDPDALHCDDVNGFGYLKRFLASGWDYCVPDQGNEKSTIRLYHLQKPHEQPNTQSFASFSNVMLDMRSGAQVRANCKVVGQQKSWDFFRKWFGAIVPGNDNNAQELLEHQCDQWIENPVILIWRDGIYNLWHYNTNLFNVFAVQQMLGFKKENTLIVGLDTEFGEDMGPYKGTWDAFGTFMMFGELKRKYGQRVCFRNAAFAIPGRESMIWTQTNCARSPLMLAWRNMVLDELGLLNIPPVLRPHPQNRKPKVVVVQRADVQKRRIINFNSLFEELLKYSDYADFYVADFASMEFKEQVRLVRDASVLVGLHGGGLEHLLWMPESVLVEFHLSSWHSTAYDLHSRMMGNRYFSWINPDRSQETYLPPMDKPPHTSYEHNKSLRIPKDEFLRMVDMGVACARSLFQGSADTHERGGIYKNSYFSTCGFLHCPDNLPLLRH